LIGFKAAGGVYSVMSYAGDVDPTEAWKMLSEDERATLVDVRTRAEWSYVGVPELSGIGKRPLLLEWQTYPAMTANPDFVASLARAVPDKDTPLLFLCRSGARSRAAAVAMTAAGYRRCYNVANGFEGNPDAARHRGQIAGWKAAGLPWAQD
jgi:rhodanese-related sulfurtransferase